MIDAHLHFWEYDSSRHSWISEDMRVLRRNFLPEHLEPELNKTGIDGCIAVHTEQTEEDTVFLLKLADKYLFIKGVIGWLDLQADDVENRIREFVQYSLLKGVRHIVQNEPDDRFLLLPDFKRGISLLKKYDLCYDILIYPSQLPAAITFVSNFPEQKFVLDHLAKPNIKEQQTTHWKEKIYELARHPFTFCKVSGMVTEAEWGKWKPEDFKPYLDTVFEAFGVERLIFGSDWPICTLAADYAEVLQIVEDYIAHCLQMKGLG